MKKKIILLIALLFSPKEALGLPDNIVLVGTPGTLVVSSANAGQQPNSSPLDTSTTYNVSTLPGARRKITGQLNVNTPTGVTLKATLQAPSGATSAGAVTVTTTAKDMVTNISAPKLIKGLKITYQLFATVKASPTVGQTVQLTYTIL